MATLLLDTHALLWWLGNDPRLIESARRQIEDPANDALVSAVSAWEISIKTQLGKLAAPPDLEAAAEATGLRWIPIEPGEAYAAGRLPMHHKDPFDRLLVAQGLARSARLISADGTLDAYGVERLWT